MSFPEDDEPPFESPFNAIPPLVLAIALAAAAVEVWLSAGALGLTGGATAIGWRSEAITDYAFSPLVWDQIAVRGNTSLDMVQRLVSYAFVHGSFTQALFGVALLLALGKFVGEVVHPLSLALLLLIPTVAGAVVFGIVFDGPMALIGLFTPVYGLIGAFTYLLWLRLGQMGENRLNAFRLIGVLMIFQLAFALLFGASPVWVSEVAGFVTGFAASVLLAPGGWTAFLNRMRARS